MATAIKRKATTKAKARKPRKLAVKNQSTAETVDPRRNGGSFIVGRRHAGIHVTEDFALTYSAVWSAVRVISEAIASLSWWLMTRDEGGNKKRIEGTNISRLLRRPNNETGSFVFRETMMAWALTWGNGYAEIERDLAGRPRALWLIAPNRVELTRDAANNLIYLVRNFDGSTTVIAAADMLHVKGLTSDGLTGLSVIRHAARSLSIGIAAEDFGAEFFGNGAALSGVLEHPETLDKEGRENLKDSWQAAYGGSHNSGKTAVLEEGMKYTPIGIPPDDAQFLQTRKFQVNDVARWFKVPPHKLGDLDRATFNNIEEQNIEFVQDTVVPWAMRLEQEADEKLLGIQSRVNQFTHLNVNSLLRGSQEKRFKGYAVGRQWGWLSVNDIRKLEQQNTLDEEIGDVYLSPLNMTPAELLGLEQLRRPPPPAEPALPPAADDAPPPPASNNGEAILSGFHVTLEDAAARCLQREYNRATRAPKSIKSPADFADWMASFYDKHRAYVSASFMPGARGMMLALGRADDDAVAAAVDVFSTMYCTESQSEINAAYKEGNLKSFAERSETTWPAELSANLSTWLLKALQIDRTEV